MKTRILILALIAAFTFVALPSSGYEASAQRSWRGNDRGYISSWSGRQWRNKGKKKRHWGYKNYGQYRRTQVGNRRYRLERRYYWRDGYRYSRLIRIYF